MEINLIYCTRTGRTISEKTMEDGNIANVNDDKIIAASLANIYSDRLGKLTTNGHNCDGESSNPDKSYVSRRQSVDNVTDEKCKKRINPLRIHLGKRPFVENTLSFNSVSKKRKPFLLKPSETSIPKCNIPRVPKLIPKRIDHGQFHGSKLHGDNVLDNEQDKPVPRLVPKSQIHQFKKGKIEKGSQLKEYAQSLGLQPMVKFKCRKCCSMSFKTLAMLKEHQLVCRAQAKEPTLSPEAAPSVNTSDGGPSRVTRKVYLCSACGTYYENWNLFLHMREVHNRHICLFCLGMFSKAEKLSAHLSNKHNVQEFNFESKEEFCSVHNGTFYLMCCVCDEICSEKDDFFNHDCNNVKPKPVPVLVSKNSVKTNMKYCKSNLEPSSNGPKETVKPICDKKEVIEPKKDVLQNLYIKNNCENPHNESLSSMNTSATMSSITSDTVDDDSESEHAVTKVTSPKYSYTSQKRESEALPNGDDHKEESEENFASKTQVPIINTTKPNIESPRPAPEKEGGIKLKLSLNNANSPVIINSTVDPTIGQNYVSKPPSRNRRPPKRYEKEKLSESITPVKPPSIKMTICDRADSPFVKTTIFENNKETVVKTLINNNNVESASIKTPETKPENVIKTTIYDNKFEDDNNLILNRVPKLTVKVPKEFLDKDSSSDYSSDSDASDKLTVDDKRVEQNSQVEEQPIPESTSMAELQPNNKNEVEIKTDPEPILQQESDIKTEDLVEPKVEPKSENQDVDVTGDISLDEPPPADDISITELTLDKPLDKYPLKDLLKVFLASTYVNCIYCNHARVIAVNCEQLALHMVNEHRFAATVNSITAEELMPETITSKLKLGAEELQYVYLNLDSYDSVDKYDTVNFAQVFECFQCYFKTAIHKDLYLHNRKMHQKTILLCVMCKNNFYTYSELICHLCPGAYDSEYEIRFRCCFCNIDTILSTFRLMVHLRKIHHTCDVCLEFCQSQSRLSNHVWKHKLHHLCYRCGIAYRNKPDINNHLFWKHGTESVLCKRCLQKKWPHVYHFCTPPTIFVCDDCNLQFTKAVYLKVHKRFHSEEFPHVCVEEGCTEKFVSKKLLNKHLEEHTKKLFTEELSDGKTTAPIETCTDGNKEQIPVIDLVDEKTKEAGSSEDKAEAGTEQISKKNKKKKNKEKDALLLDVDLPALNLSESDSSDESDSGHPPPVKDELQDKTNNVAEDVKTVVESSTQLESTDVEMPLAQEEEKIEQEDKPNEQQVLEIWDNFKKYQAKVEKQKEKTPPLVPIRKHVCESDHDYCVIPTDFNGEEESLNKKKNKKSPKKRHGDLSSSSSSSSDSDSSCSCGSNCSCSSSSGSSSSSSSDSDSSDESGKEKKKSKQLKKSLPNRRISNGSNVDVMGMSETPVLVPEKQEPLIAETDLETEESETDEEFYDENPQQIANKMFNEKRNQLMLLASVAPSDGGSVSGDVSRCTSPVKEEEIKQPVPDIKKVDIKQEPKEKVSSGKKKSKKKKKSKGSRKHGPIKINIPKDVIRGKSEAEATPPLAPNKITISLHSNTVQLPEIQPKPQVPSITSTPVSSLENKRASKRRRVPNKFYGYSSDEETPQTVSALKPQLPPKLEWRKEDLPSPVTHKPKKEIPSIVPQRLFNYNEPIRLTTPIPDPEPPKILMNSESMESSDSDSSDEGALHIHTPGSVQNSIPVPPPTYLNSGTSSLPYPFQRPAVRQAREGESVYCYCRCPYDEVSEMIACDAEGCPIEWFHFECVGIMVPPKGKWYCPECRKNQSFSGYR